MFSSGWAKITAAGNSAADWFTQQITYRGRVSKSVMYNPYGFHANAEKDKSVAFWIGVNGDASNKIGFAWNPNIRPDLKEGEVSMYQPTKNTFITFLQDGTIEINTDVAINVTSPDVTVTATSSVTVDSPDIQLQGDTTITGALTVTTTIDATGEVTGNGVALSAHVHLGQGSLTAPNGGGPVTGSTAAPT